jgi:hypothetical protein
VDSACRHGEPDGGAAPLAQRAVAGIAPGDHVCACFGSDDEHGAIVARYVREALARNQRVLYLADRSDDATIRAYLAAAGIDMDAGIARGQIKLRRLGHEPRRIDPEGLIAVLQSDRVAALRAGFSALSGTAEMSWALTLATDATAVLRYEREVSRVFQRADVAALCQYDRRLFDPGMLQRLVATHDFRLSTGPEGTTTARRHLTIAEREDGVLALAGALDMDAAAYLAARLAEAARDRDLVVLTAGLRFADISGCRTLVNAAEALAPGRRLVLPDPSTQLVRMLRLCGWSAQERLVVGDT